MDRLKRQRFLVQRRGRVVALVFPRADIAKLLVVPLGLAFRRLELLAEVAAAGFGAVQGVSRHQFPELEEVRDASGHFEALVEIVR